MVRFVPIIISLLLLTNNFASAQQPSKVNKTVYVSKAGTLIDIITLEEAQTVTHLTITGVINAIDFKNLRNDFDKLRFLDLSNTTIQSYIGKRGTSPNEKFNSYGSNAIPAYAFCFSVNGDIVGKSTLREVVLSDKIKNIEENAFNGCKNLSICRIIKNTPPNISSGGLDPKITALFIPDNSKYNYERKLIWRDFVLIEGDPIRISVQVKTPGTLNQEVEAALKEIDSNKRNPKDINFLTIKGIPNQEDYKYISDFMTNLITVNLHNTETKAIPDLAFANKKNLLKIILPKTLKTVGERAFSECERMSGVLRLPKSVKEIEYGAFMNTSLDYVIVTGGHLNKLGKNTFGDKNGKLILSIDDENN